MRLMMILMLCLVPATQSFCAEDSGERSYPIDDRSACMDREMDSARGGCVMTPDGSPRSAPPQALPPAPDSTRQSPLESPASERRELPIPGGETR